MAARSKAASLCSPEAQFPSVGVGLDGDEAAAGLLAGTELGC